MKERNQYKTIILDRCSQVIAREVMEDLRTDSRDADRFLEGRQKGLTLIGQKRNGTGETDVKW